MWERESSSEDCSAETKSPEGSTMSHHASPNESPSDQRAGSVESVESISAFDNVVLLEQTDSLRELHTILRNKYVFLYFFLFDL